MPQAGAVAARSPDRAQGFRAAVRAIGGVAAAQRRHGTGHGAARAAQAAAPGPAGEVEAQAGARQVEHIDAQQARPFDAEGFAAQLRARLAEKAPRNPEEARSFPGSGKLGELNTELTATARARTADSGAAIKGTATAEPDRSGVTAKPVVPLPAAVVGPKPADVGAAGAVPERRPDDVVMGPVDAGTRSVDATMVEAGVTERQLAGSREPTFTAALADRRAAADHAATVPARYRATETTTISSAQAGAVDAAGLQTSGMHTDRATALHRMTGEQHGTMTADQAARVGVTTRLEEIYRRTRESVEARLALLDKEVGDAFGAALTEARTSFEDYVKARLDERYSSWSTWVDDKLLTWGLPGAVQRIYDDGRAAFLHAMDAAIDRVARLVADGLNEAKSLAAAGRAEVADAVEKLDPALREVGAQAAAEIGGRFDELDHTVSARQDQLVDTLAANYQDGITQLDDRITELQEENAGFLSKAVGSVTGAVRTILELKDLLLRVLAKASGTLDVIIADPIRFLGNLVRAVGAGVGGFLERIGIYLQKGLVDWLFGQFAAGGITMPATFDLKGIFHLVMQVMGLTWASIRKIAVEVVGEPIVAVLETVAEPILVLVREGPGGLWEWVKDQLTGLKTMVWDQIQDWLVTNVIKAGITWVVGLLNPASAFVKACMAIYDVLQFVMSHGKQILEFVSAIVDTIAEIASGSIGNAAKKVEAALAKAIPVTIGFLAGILGLGNVSETIKAILAKVQAPVHKAVKWVITKAVALVKAAGKLLGFGKEDAEKESHPDPLHDAKVDAGLVALAARERGVDGRGQTHAEAETAAREVRHDHPVFTSMQVVGEGTTWDFVYTASKGKKVTGAKKATADGDGTEALLRLDKNLAAAIEDLKTFWAEQNKDYEEYVLSEGRETGAGIGDAGRYNRVDLAPGGGLEREHIVPSATMNAITEAHGFTIGDPEYQRQFTLVVSKRTADIKTGRSSTHVAGVDGRYQSRDVVGPRNRNLLSGDNRVTAKIKKFMANQLAEKSGKTIKLRQLFDAKVELTIRARNEAKETTPTDAEIRGATLAQIQSVLDMVRERHGQGPST